MEEITSVFNPTNEDLVFKYNSEERVLKAGEKKDFLTPVAIHAASKLADKAVKTSNPEEKKVFVRAYLENSDPFEVAKRLNIDLVKIRKEAVNKDKERSRVINLETQVMEQNKKIEMLLKLSEVKDKPVVAEEEANKVDEEEAKKVDKRTKEYKEANKSN